jgi:hypothetical protein
MVWPRCAVMCLLVTLGASPGAAADLTTIDRTTRKEPAYQSKAPLYCLLVFGPEARVRAWLVLDDKVLYLDRNGNGDLTEEGERLGECQVNSRFGPDDPTGEFREFAQVRDAEEGVRGAPILRSTSRYKGLIVDQALPKKDYVAKTPEQREALARVRKGLVRVCLVVDGEDRRIIQDGRAAFARRPQDAPILWFDGPLTLALAPADSRKTEDLEVRVVTPGLGEGSVTVLQEDSVPEGAHPVATIVFPARFSGGPPVTTTVHLDQRC